MRFALYLNPQTRGAEDDASVINLVTRMSIEADRLGFTAVMLTEHHFTGGAPVEARVGGLEYRGDPAV